MPFVPRSATVLAVAFLVAGCSNGGAKHSSSPTTSSVEAGIGVAPPTTQPCLNCGLHVPLASLITCPSQYPDESLTKLNATVTGLDKKLVPIAVTVVRVCKYVVPDRFGGAPPPRMLVGSALLESSAAVKFTDETNRLPSVARQHGACGSSSGPEPMSPGPSFVIMFAGRSRRVTVNDDFVRSGTSRPSPCVATNGFSSARPTPKWGDELQRYATRAK